MATFTWAAGNRGMYGYRDFQDFDRTSATATALTLTYNGNSGTYNRDEHAFRVVLTTTGRTTFTPDEGPDAGHPVTTGGTVTKVTWFNQAGTAILSATGLSANLALIEQLLVEEPHRIWDVLAMGNNTYTGSANSGGSDWNGDDIGTGIGRDTVRGGGGDDFIMDGGGADRYDGGAGWDTLSYQDALYVPHLVKRGLDANFVTGKVIGWDGLTDTITSIEEMRGTFRADKFTGNGADNRFMGLAGADTLTGAGGFDMVAYTRDARQGGGAGARVNLATNTARDGFGHTDRLSGIEGADGTDVRDIFTDNSSSNYFRGREGADVFNLSGGSDTARGDGGADRFVFKGAFGTDRVQDFSKADGDRIEIDAATSFGQLAISQQGSNARIAYLGNVVLLENVTASTLDAGDFVF